MSAAQSPPVDIQEDLDLLMESDAYLENHRRDLAQSIDLMQKELGSVLSAQRFKTMLQQTNRVVLVRGQEPSIMPLTEALTLLRDYPSAEISTQSRVWAMDGYDLHTTRQLI